MKEKIMRKLPVGIEKFKEIRTEKFYYIDKTAFIKELMDSWGKVNLFTRPRRFGKSLNMDMLRSFFGIGADAALFEGLQISEEKELCEKYLGQYPVISISLKDVESDSYEMSYELLSGIIYDEALRLQWLLDSDRLTKYDKAPLQGILDHGFRSQAELCQSIKLLSGLLYKQYDKKVIILIDEYDVPLNKAYQNGYYDRMVSLIRTMFSMALKTNDSLLFAVLTGCLQGVAPSPLGSKRPRQVDEVGFPAKLEKTSLSSQCQSIFTGLNNFKVHAISDVRFDEYFGFTDAEVRKLLADYGMEEKYEEVREWYDGYRFGHQEVYCPWDVLNYVSDHLADRSAEPALYWANSSGNMTVRDIIEQSTGTVRSEIELLVSGGVVKKKIIPEMTYQDLASEDPEEKMTYLWSLLYNTGYLTDTERAAGGVHSLAIPNREVRLIFEQQILTWFSKAVKSDTVKLRSFCDAVKDGNAEEMQKLFNGFLRRSISIRDSAVRKGRKESFYHGILVGLMGSEESWIVRSNPESGEGYSDILVEIPDDAVGCVFEIKYAENKKFESACREAMAQIREKDYAAVLRDDGMEVIHVYGVACCLKECRILHEEL